MESSEEKERLLKRMKDEIGDSPKRPLNWSIFAEAQNIMRAADFLGEQVDAVFRESRPVDNRVGFLHSSVLLNGYALELMLKALIIIDHDEAFTAEDLKSQNIEIPHTHNLRILFQALPEDTQRAVINEYRKLDAAIDSADSVIERIGIVGEEVFVDWRYLYEHGEFRAFHLEEMRKLRCAIERAVVDKKT